MRSCKGGWHGLASWGCFRRLPETGAGLRADDGRNSLPDAGSSLAAPDLCLAELRHVSEISRADGFPGVLAEEARRAAILGHRRAFQADQAGRAARGGRRVPAALKASAVLQGSVSVTHHASTVAERSGGLRER